MSERSEHKPQAQGATTGHEPKIARRAFIYGQVHGSMRQG